MTHFKVFHTNEGSLQLKYQNNSFIEVWGRCYIILKKKKDSDQTTFIQSFERVSALFKSNKKGISI